MDCDFLGRAGFFASSGIGPRLIVRFSGPCIGPVAGCIQSSLPCEKALSRMGLPSHCYRRLYSSRSAFLRFTLSGSLVSKVIGRGTVVCLP